MQEVIVNVLFIAVLVVLAGTLFFDAVSYTHLTLPTIA